MPNASPFPDSPDASITRWFNELQHGDDEAVARLWEHYFPRLVAFARANGGDRDVAYGADDAALSVFDLMCRGARDGRINRVKSRGQLWALLVKATRRKIIDRARRATAAKRGGGTVKAVAASDAQLVAPEPGPELFAIMDEHLQRLMDHLEDDTLRTIAIARLEGCRKTEIAERLNVSQTTIARKLKLIQDCWQSHIP